LRELAQASAERLRAAMERVPLSALREACASLPPARGFRSALDRPGPRIIAEVKRASPSAGALRTGAAAAEIAALYERSGAAAISVLTEPTRFGGSLHDLAAVRHAVALPLLRKDFTVGAYQVWEARAAGADAVLLIVAMLQPPELTELLAEAALVGVDALVEVHDAAELEVALAAGATLIGVNNRNLHTLHIDLATSAALAPRLRAFPHVLAVSESGIQQAEHVRQMMGFGYRALLVGSHLMSSPDPGAALTALLAPEQP
jgi:indole-3-glycerol phosphate synthase